MIKEINLMHRFFKYILIVFLIIVYAVNGFYSPVNEAHALEGNPEDEGLHVEGSLGVDKDLTVAGTITGFGTSPIGSITAFAGKHSKDVVDELASDGWLECNGQGVSIDNYPKLYAVIGTMYGGNGDPTFHIPDYRGMFLRGWNHGRSDNYKDPEASSRSNRGDGIGGDDIGTKQSHSYSDHGHRFLARDGTHIWYYSVNSSF